MAIKRGSHAHRRRFDRAGIIRLGAEKIEGEFATELSYFRLTDAPELVEEYGENPRELDIMLPSDDPEEVFEDRYELWRGSNKPGVRGTLLCYGDGIVAERLGDEDRPFDRDQVECLCPHRCSLSREKTSEKNLRAERFACSAVGRLRVICHRVNIVEVYEIRTGSINAFQGIRNKLEFLLDHPMFGKLTGIPLRLVRRPQETKFGGTIYPVHLEIPGWADMEKELRRLAKIVHTVRSATSFLPAPAEGGTRALPAPGAPGDEPEDLVGKSQWRDRGEGESEPPPPPPPPPAPPREDPPAPPPPPPPAREPAKETIVGAVCEWCRSDGIDEPLYFRGEPYCSAQCIDEQRAALARISTDDERAEDQARLPGMEEEKRPPPPPPPPGPRDARTEGAAVADMARRRREEETEDRPNLLG